MREYRDLEAFEGHFDTLQLDAPTLGTKGDRTLVPGEETIRLAPPDRLHTLPELHLDGDDSLETPPDLRLLGTLGEGGMGLVRLANQVPLDREVAVKTTRKKADEEAARALLQEAYVTGYLEHPNILPIYTVGRTRDGAPLIVMKRVEGTSWADMLDQTSEAERPDALVSHVEILIQVCNAVRFAHSKGILHRDIKPENVMIGHFDEVYLLDWGIAVSLDEEKALLPKIDQADGVAGTPQYMAPEMTFESADGLDERTDVYLLGATLHHILTGRPRHTGARLLEVMYNAYVSTPYQYDDSVPAELAAIARKACRPKREERYQSVEAFREALDDFLRHRESIALAASAEEKRVELEQLLNADEVDSLKVHDTYGECRFGFYQALRMWPENELATKGLQSCLEAMAEFYLENASVDAARACIAELPEPRPALADRVDELASRLEEDQEDFRRLKRLERNMDLRTAATSRSRIAIIFGVLWTATTIYAALRADMGEPLSKQLRGHMISGFRNLFIIAVVLLVFRKRIFANAINRRLLYLLMGVFSAVAFLRWGVWYIDGSLVMARAADKVVYALSILAVGLMSDLRICPIAAGFATSAVVGLIWPEWQIWAGAAANAVTFGGLAWLWRPSRMKRRGHQA